MATKQSRKTPSATQRLEAARENRYKVINERNLLLLALIKASGWTAHLEPTVRTVTGDTWARVLCVHTPAGQLTWKLSDADREAFGHLQMASAPHYDGCGASAKLERLISLGVS